MAALLRHGVAKSLGGSMVQRAEAAVSEGRHRLGPRLVHTDEHVREELLREIQQKKEEVYNVLAKAERNFWTSSFRNKLLLQHLAVQINPRPDDSQWRRMYFARKATTVLEATALISLAGAVVAVVVR